MIKEKILKLDEYYKSMINELDEVYFNDSTVISGSLMVCKKVMLKLIKPFKEYFIDGIDNYDIDKSQNKEYYKEFFVSYMNFIDSNEFVNFIMSPASGRYHGCYTGGLFDHSLRTYQCALKLAPLFNIDYKDVNIVACILHDACKIGLYKKVNYPNKQGYEYNNEMTTMPHGSESVYRISVNYGFRLDEPWRMAVTYHMGAFEVDNARAFGNMCEKFPEVMVLHTADMMASKFYNM